MPTLNKQIYQFPVGALTLQSAIPIQPTTGGTVEKVTIQDLVTFIQTLGVVGGALMFQTMADMVATTVLLHKNMDYITLGDPSIFEDGAEYYYDQTSMLADNGRSIRIPNSINPLNPGRFIQRQ